MAVDYNLYPHMDSGVLRDAAVSSINVMRALEHRTKIDSIVERTKAKEISEPEGARLCVKECDAGIDLLKAGSALGEHTVLNILSDLRDKRAAYQNRATMDDLQWQKKPPSEIEVDCRQMFDDATAVIDLAPTHSTPSMVRSARGSRMAALGYLNNSLKVRG